MAKIYLFFAVFIISSAVCMSQTAMGIGTATPHPSAMLDLSKTTRGFLMPRMTQSARLSIANPAEGLMVFDTTTHRLYLYQDNSWRFFANNNSWILHSNGNYIYSTDSIGIGNAGPTRRLDVSGNIRVRSFLKANNNIIGSLSVQANAVQVNSNSVATGISVITGNATTKGDIILSSSAPTLQIKNVSTDRVFIQNSGDDLRLGTNSGNELGEVIIRMDGNDLISLDTSGSLRVLAGSGNLNMGAKLCRQVAPGDNMLPVAQGRINADGTIKWMSQNGTVTRKGPGQYEVLLYSGRISARSAFIVTPGGSSPRICAASYVEGTGIMKVDIYDPINRVFIDADFNFIIHEPLNIFQ